jgi:hypothetical protein
MVIFISLQWSKLGLHIVTGYLYIERDEKFSNHAEPVPGRKFKLGWWLAIYLGMCYNNKQVAFHL